MATMSMGIGGAETHILELAKALVQKGHQVTVASNGGVYVAALLAAGVRHVQVPMHRRSVRTMVQSYLLLRRLMRRERFDLVHAHARIPGFLVGLAVPRGMPFVTTAHGMFLAGGLTQKLSNWGQKTIAVSADIRSYLIEQYGVSPADIFPTINGIDMERFSPEASGSALRAELSIDDAASVVLHVSRLDAEPGIVAAELIAIAPALISLHPDLHIVIVGGGDRLSALQEEAAAVNAQLGRTALHLTGARTDIDACVLAADLFVGVSRAALEAMSAARPVVLAGAQGYIGIFDETKLEDARRTNFCGRGLAATTSAQLERDIHTCLTMPPEAQAELGRFGRALVAAEYSIETMVGDTLRAYDAALVRSRRLLVSGYYGFHNAGDEAILDALILSTQNLPGSVEVTVLSNTPEDTARKHRCRAVHRFKLMQVLSAMRRTDALVSGGGSLLQDKSSTRSIVYYLAVIRLAKLFRRPVMLYANGIGPVSRPMNRRLVRAVLNRVDLITLREESSRDELLRMGVTKPALHVTADPIFLLDAVSGDAGVEALRAAGVPGDRPLIGVSVRSLRTGSDFVAQMAALCDRLTQELSVHVVFIAMQMPHDAVISRQIMERMEQSAYLLGGDITPEALIGATGQMQLVLAMRLHTMLFAAKAETPVVGLVCDPKIAYFGEKLTMPSGGAVEDFETQQMFALLEAILAERRVYQARLRQAVLRMDQGARENESFLAGLLGFV